MNDADGTPANIRYQWFADGKPIAGATAQTFTLTAAQQGAKITVQATYTDLAQHAEAPQSAATAAVSGLPPQNHAPTDISLSAATVAEGKDGASVGKLTTTDPDAGDAHRYTVSDARFEVTADGTLQLKAGLHLDYAAEKTVALTVTATDAGGLATQKTFTLSVQDDPNYPAPNPQPNPNPQPPSAATLTVRETDDATPGSIVVGKLGAGEALTVGETTLNAAKLAELAHQPRTVIDDDKGTLTLTGYDAASGTLTYRYDPKEHASHDNQQATVDFIIGREAFRGTNGVGVQPFNPRWAGDDSAAIEESYARAAALGVKWVRITAGWNQVQPQDDGSYDWRYVDDAVRLAQKYGMKVLMQVMGTPNWASDIGDLPAAQQQKLAQEGYWTSTHAPKAQHDADFARFFGEAVKRYSAQGIHDFEFWNEPGNKFWRDSWANPNPNPEHYTRLLKLVYEAAHAADAEANVLAGGMTVGDSRADGSYISPQEFLERMYKAGAQGYFDALSHHPYGILAKDYKDNGWAQMSGDIVAPGAGEKTLMQIMQAHGDGGKLIWPSEVGWDAMFAGLAETWQANTIKTLLEWQQKADYTGPMILYQAQNDRAAYVQGILNRDDNGDGIVDVNIDTNGDGIPDANIDADHNNRPDLLDAADREAYYGFWKNDGSEKPAVGVIKSGTPQTPAAATLNITIENVDTPQPPQNHAPDDITLSASQVAEGQDGATVGKLTAHDPDSGDTHTYTVSDARFEVTSDGTLKLKAGQHLDYAAEKTVALTVTATDAGGLSTQKTFTLNVQDDPVYPAPNQPGSVSITGDAQVGGTLSAQIADADGFNPAQVQYQWQRDGQPIDGATSSQYTLKAEDAGHKISVQARYDDNAAHHETPTSPASDIPAADPHAGALAVTGAAKVGAILTTAITDADGVPQVGIHYQWFADGKAIEGATHEVYRIRPEDIGKSISVQASYTDNSGHAETTNTAAVAQNVADNPATQGAHGHKLYAHEEFGKYIDARDFGVNPANADNTAALKAALKAADDEGAALYLGAGTLKLHEQLRIGTDIFNPDGSLKQEGYQNVRAIFGAGMGKTKLTFDWQQQGEYDPAHNATDARDLAGVLIDGINGKSIADLSVAYQHQTAADFYRPQASYFGKINGIVVNDADNTRIDTVEVTGANRAGVFFTSTATSLSGARQALIDHQISEADAPAGDNNQLLYSNLHHNRVAGAMIGYQRGFSADSNTAAYNGHEADGGTGYGIATLGGSYNFGVSYTRNITDHNYRKGLDSHEGNHIHIENNISNGDRLVGLGVSNHQFTMDNVTIRHNTIIADPNFRCTSDDGDKDAQIGQGENYHAYEGINLLTNIESNKIDLRSQGPGTFDISDNTIRGLETYNDANTSAIAVHNYEPTMDYTLNIRDNHIDATSVKTAIAINNATRGLGGSAGEGSGDIRVSGNTIHITKTGGRPSSLIYIAETEHDGTLRGSVVIENNRVQIDARDDKGEIIRLTGNAKTYDISGNVLEQHGNSNTTLITINGQGSTEKTTLNVHDNTLAADWPRPGKHWIEAGTESVAGAHIQSHNNTYNGAAITEDAPPAQNHAPDDITLSASQVAEGQDGATVGKLTAHDPDAGDTHTYKTSDDRFEVTSDGTLKLKAGQHLDYAAEKTVTLTITATDAGGLSTQKTFTLHTTNPADTFARDNLPPDAAYQIVADLGAAKTAIAANPTLQNLIISDGDHHALLQKNSTGYSDNMPPGWTLTCKNHIPAVAFHDGGADLAPALNAAAQAAKTLQLGIELPAQREYQLGSQITLENGVPYLHGNGSTLAVQNSVNEAALKLPNGASQGEISGLTLNMNAAPGVHGILGYDLHDYRIHDNHILHLGQRPGHPGYGITVYSGSGHTENITVENNHISAKPSNGEHADAPVGIAFNGAQQPGNPQWRDAKAPVWRQYVEDGTVAEADPSRTIKHITVRGNQVSGTYYGVAFSTVSDSEISGNHLHHNTRNISLQDRSNHNTVRDNILTDAHSSAIHIAYASSDNHIENNHIMTTRAGGQAILQAYQGSKNNHYHNNHIDVAHDATTNFMYTATDSSGTTYRDNIASGRVSRASIGAESIWDKTGAGDEKSAYGNNMQDPNLYDGDITHGGGHGALTGLTISGNILAPEPTFAGAPITYLGADSSHGLHGDKTLHGDLDATLNDNTWLGADGREAIRQHQSGDSHVHLHGNGIAHADGTTYHHGTTAYSIGDYTLANDETTLYLLGTHATSGSGNSGDNQLYGNAQTNRLSGGAGNDHLDGGYGSDTLTGGAGADTFTFASLLDGKNIDTITDFNAGEGDKIALNQAVFGRLGDNWYAAAGQHITHTTRVYQQGDTLYHDPDGSGSAYSATAFAKVNTVLEEGHFSLI